MNFVIGLPISANWKNDSYNSTQVIIDQLTKIVYYEPVKVIINELDLAKVIINMVICHHGVPELIVIDQSLLFTSKF